MRAQAKMPIVRAEKIGTAQPTRAYPAGRTCDSCPNRLSIYNSTNRCAPCEVRYGPETAFRLSTGGAVARSVDADRRARSRVREISSLQRSVLERIRDCGEIGAGELQIGAATRLSLVRRGLVVEDKTLGRASLWTYSLTEAGREVLASLEAKDQAKVSA